MGMLAFFPWLRIRETVQVGAFQLHPHSPEHLLGTEIAAQVGADDLKRILMPYRIQPHQPLRQLVLVQFNELPLGADFDETARKALFDFARNLAVAGLAVRRFDGNHGGAYSATGHYQLLIQAYPEPFTGSVSLSHRRKDGVTKTLVSSAEHVMLLPEHLVNQVALDVDWQLLLAMDAARSLPDEARERIEASISQFLLANSDAPEMPFDPESVATYAAFERLVDADQKLSDLRSKLLSLLGIVEACPATPELRRTLKTPHGGDRAVFGEWMRHLYGLRGNAGHGHLVEKFGLKRWEQRELLMSAALMFPLALKCFLQEHAVYSLTEADAAHLVGFDLLLEGTPFFGQPRDLSLPPTTPRERSGWVRAMEQIGMAIASYQLGRTVREVVADKVAAGDAAKGDVTQR